MSTAAIVAVCVVAAIVVIAVVAFAVRRARRRHLLQQRFGQEYDRTMLHADNRRSAERDLRQRLDRRSELEIVPLAPAAAARYLEQWQAIQTQFVDQPVDAVHSAHRLVTTVMGARGYPTDDRDERMALLSVDHSDVVDRYRDAGRIEAISRDNRATTEQLRQAFQHYRALFDRLLETDRDVAYPGGGRHAAAYPADDTPAHPDTPMHPDTPVRPDTPARPDTT